MDGRQLPIDEYISFSDKDYKRNIVHVSSKCEFTVLCFKKDRLPRYMITVALQGLQSYEMVP